MYQINEYILNLKESHEFINRKGIFSIQPILYLRHGQG